MNSNSQQNIIVLTGGGTAGHVTPNIALVPRLNEEKYSIQYIGSKNGIEKDLIEKTGIPFHSISSGKLRRYFSFKNLTDMFRIVKGLGDAIVLIKKIKPKVVFSKGGYVTVPVIIASKLMKIPVVIHESDITPGLANKISMPFANKICVSFPETLEYIPEGKGVLTGSPIRKELFEGDRERGKSIFGIGENKPVLLLMGGSLGSVTINKVFSEILVKILKDFDVIHICGKDNSSEIKLEGYKQYEFIGKELAHAFALADIIVSRAGANSIFEFLALRKPNLLIPLSKKASRGDQILNADSFKAQGYSQVIYEEDLTSEILYKEINELYKNRADYINNMNKSKLNNGIERILNTISDVAKK